MKYLDGQQNLILHRALTALYEEEHNVIMQRCVLILLTCLLLLASVAGPTAPPPSTVTVEVGADAVLPFHLGVAVNPSTLRMECVRSDLSSGFVFVWVEGRERAEHKRQPYRGRTSVVFDTTKPEDVSLKLTNVTALDEGTYTCRVPQHRRSCSVQLLPYASSPPAVRVVKEVGHTAELWCESAGWHPKPDVSWFDESGKLLPAESAEMLRDADGLFRVSSRVRVDKRRSHSATCRLQTQSVAQSRETSERIRVLTWYMYGVLGLGLIGVFLAAGFEVQDYRRRNRTVCRKNAELEANVPKAESPGLTPQRAADVDCTLG
ncbi:hypothetical protein OJAV_G00184830 [Oryzias javanicus]|uniref:Ig-like domain-containing protein n=1 Tax=Oryzias javanicus TaxID=123683 RepID=A0A3S2P9C6_ORYJA|nr:hypothetical protein OJAV_G00184830 [Oryzias javanicus]